MPNVPRILLVFLVSFVASHAFAVTNNDIFLHMAGPSVMMDSQVAAKVLKDGPGKKTLLDTDGDGRVDRLYFIDTDDRHENKRSPLLVMVVDEDGDMARTGGGDLDSDLWVADWYGDGTIDRIVDYADLDGDNDVDEQILYQWTEMSHIVGRSTFKIEGRAWFAAWGRDIGDDNRLWFDANYEYDQPLTEWKTDFNGDEMFVYVFMYDDTKHSFLPVFENAFSFYDLDGDRYAEEVLRFDGTGPRSENLRYSMDIDNDTRGTVRHDYDFSISSLGPVDLPPESCMTVMLRGIPAGPVMRWEHMRRFSKEAAWVKTLLTWDENDTNVDPIKGRVHNERWEGVLNHPSAYFPQVGGPTCGALNKRNEVDADNSGKFAFYYSTVDHRLHLHGAEKGWITTDADYDGRPDMRIWMEDTDGNGFFDLWKYDADADSVYEREFRLKPDTAAVIPFEYDALQAAFLPALDRAIEGNRAVAWALRAALESIERPFAPDAVEEYYRNGLAGYEPDYRLGERMKNSREAIRYYGDIVRERYWLRFARSSAARDPKFPDILRAYERGDLVRAAALIAESFPGTKSAPVGGKTASITLSNPSGLYLENQPFVIKTADVLKAVPGFDLRGRVLTEPDPLIGERVVPSQADDLDGDGAPDEFSFVRTLEPGEEAVLTLRAPGPDLPTATAPSRADARSDWDDTRANTGWESDRCGYRLYYGQMDAFGKRLDRLILAGVEEAEYHNIADWGMDILHVGNASGIGGISVFDGARRIPAMNPGGKGTCVIKRSVVARGPVRSIAKAEISGIRSGRKTCTVTVLMSAFAGNVFSRQDVRIESSAGDTVRYSPGIMKLPGGSWSFDSTAGTLTSWGRQEDAIGDIGLGLVFRPEEYAGFAETDLDRNAILSAPSGAWRTHWVVAGWKKGFPSPVAPTAEDWSKEVRDLALRLRAPVSVTVSAIK